MGNRKRVTAAAEKEDVASVDGNTGAGSKAVTGSKAVSVARTATVQPTIRTVSQIVGWVSLLVLVVLLATRPGEEQLRSGPVARRNLYDTGPVIALMVSTNLLSDEIKEMFGLKSVIYSALRVARQRYSALPATESL
jgi:hypothetical protein